MSDHATIQDRYLELALEEVFHGGPDRGLADRILKAATVSAPPAAIPHGPSPEDSAAGPDPAPVLELAAYRPARPWWRYALEGTAAACVAGLLVLLLVPGDEAPGTTETAPVVAQQSKLPQGITAAPDAEYSSSAPGEAVTATAGWYVLSAGAPALVVGEQRVDDVQGRAIAVVGEVPTEAQVRANSTFLYQNNISEEQVMNMQWIKAGALALCVISGSAWVDATLVQAQDRQAKERKEKSPEGYLEQLRNELKELENKLQRVRNMEENDKKQDMIERIENAIEDKKDQIADVEERIAERKRREAEKKEGDGNAQRRKDAAEKEAAERKAREEKAREDKARREKAREAEETEEEREARKRREEFEEVAKEAERERERERKELEEEEKRRKRQAEEEEMKARKEREEAERKRKEGERKEGDRKEGERKEEKREDVRDAKRRKEAEDKARKEAEERERKEKEAEEAAKRKEGDRKR